MQGEKRGTWCNVSRFFLQRSLGGFYMTDIMDLRIREQMRQENQKLRGALLQIRDFDASKVENPNESGYEAIKRIANENLR
jgi:hypothetical protein